MILERDYPKQSTLNYEEKLKIQRKLYLSLKLSRERIAQRLERTKAERNLLLAEVAVSDRIRHTDQDQILDLDSQLSVVKAQYYNEWYLRQTADRRNPNLQASLTYSVNRQEAPQLYYARLRQAYFGPQNEPGTEEDVLFISNLHSTTSHHLGIAAEPD